MNKFKLVRALMASSCGAFACGWVAAASMTVAFTPTSAGNATAVAAKVSYAGVAAVSNGTQVVVCYDSTKLTYVSTAMANPPGESQPAADQVAGALCTAPANRNVLLTWLSGGGTWPSSPTASGTLAASGDLATISFTTANPFSVSTSVVATENTDLGGNYALGTATGTLNPVVVALPTVSVAASPATLVDAAANVATVTFTASAAAPAGGLSVAFTPPTAGGLIASTTCTSPIAIAAGNTTATCTVTAAVNTVPGDGPTVGTTTVIAGAGYTVGAPASATVTVNNDDVAPGTPVVTIAAAPATLVDAAGNVATVTVTSSLVAPAAGLVVNLTPAAASARYTTTCGATVTIAAGATTATCTVTAVANTTVGDGNVTATTTLAAPSASYTLGATTSAAVAVNDNDLPAAITPVTPAGALLLPSYAPGATPGRSTTALNFNVTGGAGALACVAAGAGYTATPNPLNLVVGTAGTVTVTYTGTAAGTFTGTLTCTSTAPATGGPFVYNLSTTVSDVVIPASVPVPTVGALGLGLMSLLVAGFAGFAQRRRLGK
jgi:hypothetical protein